MKSTESLAWNLGYSYGLVCRMLESEFAVLIPSEIENQLLELKECLKKATECFYQEAEIDKLREENLILKDQIKDLEFRAIHAES